MKGRINKALLSREFDVIVIGGGINGCGIARDASERGLRTLLLEKEDFSYGCTGASTRLIHGGLRYLEHFEFDLVFESLYERDLLLNNANHLVKKIPIIIPIYRSSKRGFFTIKAGMFLYDTLSFKKSLPQHKMLSKDEILNLEPALCKQELVGGAIFYDAQVQFPERICLENILMAKNNGATVLNHCEVVSIQKNNREVKSLEFVDKLANERFTAYTKFLVNATGPWIDNLCKIASNNILKKIGGTVGSHIVIKQFEDGPKHAIYTSAYSDGRPFFIIPWLNYYLVGTTDIPFSGNLDSLKASGDEVNYLLEELNRIFNINKISKSDVLFTYTGVRPLPFVNSKTPAGITRRHFLIDHSNDGIQNFISVSGKLTTYRSLSEEVVDFIFKKLEFKFVKSPTRTAPLLGSYSNKQDLQIKILNSVNKLGINLPLKLIDHLIDIYGSRVLDLISHSKISADFSIISNNAEDIWIQAEYALSEELAFTLSDLLLRRLSLGFSSTLGEETIFQLSNQIKKYFDYTDKQIEGQVDDYYKNVIKSRKIS